MRHHLISLAICTGLLAGEPALPAAIEPPNPAIAMEGSSSAIESLARLLPDENVHEPGPIIDLEASKDEFEDTLAPTIRR